jgi:hypothetical protein
MINAIKSLNPLAIIVVSGHDVVQYTVVGAILAVWR